MDEVDAAKGRRDRLALLLSLTLFLLLAAMWVALSFATGTFWSSVNIVNLLRQGAMIAVLAVGETFVIITAGIDLSVGAVTGFASMIVALLLTGSGWLTPLHLGFLSTIPGAVCATLAIGVLIGLFHGFGIVRMGLPPFIMTLATLNILRGIGLLITRGATISITNDAFTGFSLSSFGSFPFTDGSTFRVPALFWMVLLVAVPGYVFLGHTRWGRYLFAIGSNREAARLSGVNTRAITYLAYVLCSFCASFVGVLLAMRIGIGNPTQAEGWELQAIASSVIGGTSLFGAVGSVQGPIIGSFILTTINNGANLLNLNSFWQLVITGALIILIVYFDNLRRKKS
ncbi:MAG: ABC transporter permease [Hyphomicrobiales bacterium]|nr:ABC transporter permease [Hyphomicrobiales bacterium]MDE2016239.1 ABC transporter permease [Hyphomicrobiales bacterium]